MNPYASNKAILHPDRLLAIRIGGQPAPVHAHFIISDLCNQDCNFCAYRIDGYTEFFAVRNGLGKLNHNPNRMMPPDKARELLMQFKAMGGKAVQFTGGGEPTVHPHCAALIDWAHCCGLETALVTNGVRLSEGLRRILMRSTWIRVSLDCADEETYMKVRRVPAGVYGRVLDNVQALVRERGASRKPTIGMGFVVTRDNWSQVRLAAEIARDLGVDNLRISAVFQPADDAYFEPFFEQAAEAVAAAESYSTDTFTVINNFGERVSDLRQHSPEYQRCPYQHLTTFIGADMNVYRCCVLSYTRRGLLGSVADQSFQGLWMSQQKWEAMDGFDARSCPRCQFNDKNRAINSIVDGLPTIHGNFV
jgi:MoaA/NifB/PqqE/SkfB family radical SAM enzyme